jgi:hypothetical protein
MPPGENKILVEAASIDCVAHAPFHGRWWADAEKVLTALGDEINERMERSL